MRVPEDIVERGLKLSDNSMVFGVKFSEMTNDELTAIAALGWKAYTDQLETKKYDHLRLL